MAPWRCPKARIGPLTRGSPRVDVDRHDIVDDSTVVDDEVEVNLHPIRSEVEHDGPTVVSYRYAGANENFVLVVLVTVR
jgi:hypothetical protein